MTTIGTCFGEKFWFSSSPLSKRNMYLVVNGKKGEALAKAIGARYAGQDAIGDQCFYMTKARTEKFRLLFLAGFAPNLKGKHVRIFTKHGVNFTLGEAVKFAKGMKL